MHGYLNNFLPSEAVFIIFCKILHCKNDPQMALNNFLNKEVFKYQSWTMNYLGINVDFG